MDDIYEYVHKIAVARVKAVNDAIFGEIQSIAIENGFETRITVDEKNVVNALMKQIPHKPIVDPQGRIRCINGHNQPVQLYKYCPMCGQLMDWSLEEGDA
jgi:hypothetical protein